MNIPDRIRYETTAALCAICLLAGCDKAVFPVSDQKIVIDGYIEDGEYPVVIVTGTIPVSDEYIGLSEMDEYVFHWAKVTISGPEGDFVLTGQKSDKYFPPYIYTTTKFKGRAGQTYRLTADYGSAHVESETTIPNHTPSLTLRSESLDDGSGGYKIVASLNDDPSDKDYYMFLVKVEGRDSVYIPSFMGLIDDAILNTVVSDIPVFPGIHITGDGFSLYYNPGECVKVKLVTMDEASFRYWSDYHDNITFSRNPFFPSSKKMRTNISGGLGLWAGYCSKEGIVHIPDR